MTGKKIVFIIILFTIISIILTWLILEYVIEEYDIDRAMETTNLFISSVKGTIDLPAMNNKF